MLSFLQKITPKKHQNQQLQQQQQQQLLSEESPKLTASNLKHKDSITSTTSALFECETGSLASHRTTTSKSKNQTTNGGLISSKSVLSPKNTFSRKSNLSLASIGSGYFTTGRFYEHKKRSSASLGFNQIIL
jgi:hypothetical protein